ncbi:MAG: UvrD-helicase domain-containing protein [Bacteroidota bacterium]
MAIKIVSAGAGSGKTYRLSSEMVAFLQGGVRPEGIIATTFTKKAAAELQERVRVRLLQEGMRQEAALLSNALIGTVHGLGVKLLQRFAYEAGVSPNVSIIAEEDHQLLFNQALATVLTEERVDRMEQLVIHLGLVDNTYFDWRNEVRKITEVARANNFTEEILEKSKHLSIASFQNLLDAPPQADAIYFQNQLRALLDQTIQSVDTDKDSTKTTRDALFTLKRYAHELDLKKRLDWKTWARLGKLKIGAKSREQAEALIQFAKSHHQHPDFHQDIKDFTYLLFDISIDALKEYEAYKKQRGLIDYTDMEVLVSHLLDHPSIEQVLRAELDLLMVDEFQDTSPIQLEIFLKLSKLAKASVWVGDPKQSIYGFRGAAPELMQAIIEAEGGIDPANIQRYSWRSREDIVYCTNALFTKAFPKIPEEQVALLPKRTKVATTDSQNKINEPIEIGAALHHWHLQVEQEEGKKTRQPRQPWMENAIAQTLRTMLERQSFYIIPKGESEARRLQAGDVAILCRSNKQCQEMANAIHRSGLKAAISRAGLLQTAEAKLVLACLKYLLNRNDSLSIAEILLLANNEALEDIIEDRLDFLQKLEQSEIRMRWSSEVPFIQRLDELRKECKDYSSAEILDRLLEELELRRKVVSWGKIQQRLDNIDRLRYYAKQYEEACNRMYTASSLGGFLLWLLNLARQEKDMQASGATSDAVNILTYHRSKGLEWPMVICHSLDQNLRADVFGLEIMAESDQVDVNDILGNRWLRYWINPYDRSLAGTHLAEQLEISPVQAKKKQHALEEENRLLYVGITRARDYIVFPSAANPTKWLNRTWHEGREDYPTLDPNSSESPCHWNGHFLDVETETFIYPKVFTEHLIEETKVSFWEPVAGEKSYPKYFIDPVEEPFIALKNVKVGPPNYYGTPLIIPEQADKYLISKCVKAFLVAYHDDYDQGEQEAIADDLIKRYHLEGVIQPTLLLSVANNWFSHLRHSLPAGKVYRKWPLVHWYQGRQFDTIIDWVIESDETIYLVQNSGFAGAKKEWKTKVLELSSWFFLVKEAYQSFYPQKNIQPYLNLVLNGVTLKIDFIDLKKDTAQLQMTFE